MFLWFFPYVFLVCVKSWFRTILFVVTKDFHLWKRLFRCPDTGHTTFSKSLRFAERELPLKRTPWEWAFNDLTASRLEIEEGINWDWRRAHVEIYPVSVPKAKSIPALLKLLLKQSSCNIEKRSELNGRAARGHECPIYGQRVAFQTCRMLNRSSVIGNLQRFPFKLEEETS